MKGIKNRDPMKTRNGRNRLGPLSIAQLEDLIEKSSQSRDRDRYRSRLAQMISRKNKQKLKSTVDTGSTS